MTRWLNSGATVIFGIVPATLALLANALYYLRGVGAIPEGVVVRVEWGQVAVLCLLGAAGLLGYVALFYAARARVSGRVVTGLVLGTVALVVAIVIALVPWWLGSPAIVGSAHAGGYLLRRRRREAGAQDLAARAVRR